MFARRLLLICVLFVLGYNTILAHDDGDEHDHDFTFEYYNLENTLADTGINPACLGKDEAFLPYAHMVAIECDETFMYIRSYSFAEHPMMIGITLSNGQVPVPQMIVEDNFYSVPLNPIKASMPSATVGQGPIAVAINGVMIFNPTQQSGIYTPDTDPYLIGELDECGGHSGRGDDYHYHISPVCLIDELAEVVTDQPIAYALDGYPIYGFTNADGSLPILDECNGETDDDGNYHYHATETFPYINWCFTGEFAMSNQPHPTGIREAEQGRIMSTILITAHYQDDEGWLHMEYTELAGAQRDGAIIYREADAQCFQYQFISDRSTGVVDYDEVHCHRDSLGGGNRGGNGDNPPPNNGNGGNPPPPPPSGN